MTPLTNYAKACNFVKKKESLAQVFSCEFCEICKNPFFMEHLLTTASEYGPSQVQITHQNTQGLTSINFHTLPPPPLKGLQKGVLILN